MCVCFASGVANVPYFYTHSTANVCQIKFVVVVDFSISVATENIGLHVRFKLYNNDNNTSESKNEKQRGNTHKYTRLYRYTHSNVNSV